MNEARNEGGTYQRVEVITGRQRRRRWTAEEKARIVAESLEANANISYVARRHGVARGLIDAKAAGPAFVVDETDGTKRLADALWAEFVDWAQRSEHGELDDFCVAELPAQIMRSHLDDVRARLTARGAWSAVRSGLFEVSGSQAQSYAWERALAWWRMTARFAEASGEPGRADQAYALGEAGDISVLVGRTAESLKSFRDGLAIADRLAKADLGNAGWQRDQSVSYIKIGDVLKAQGNLTEALKLFRDGHAIFDRLAKADPGNAGWQRDLIVSYFKIAHLDPSEARPMLTRAAEIVSQMQSRGQLAPRNAWVPDELARWIAGLPT